MCLFCLVLHSVAGCKQSPAEHSAEPAAAPAAPAAAVSPPSSDAAPGRGQIAHRGGGQIAVSSADGKQVILLQKETGPDGKEKGVYRVCDATGTKLQCGDWIAEDAPCTICVAAEPCPCSSPACTSVCKAD
jgi:hypothetical protein